MKPCIVISYLLLVFITAGRGQVLETDSGTITKPSISERRLAIDESAASLAMYFQSLYKNKTDQLRAAYNWVTTHIRYSYDSSYSFNNADHETKVSATLRRRKGVCENYAVLFAELAAKMDIPSYVVHGYASGAASGKNTAHSWCAVYLNNDWYLCDPTWDAGVPVSTNYFLGTPVQFISSHIPFDPMWQLLEKPVGYNMAKNNALFNYKDSIAVFLRSDSLQQYLGIERRMKKMKSDKELFRIWQSYNRMQIVILAEEENMNLYNAAVADINRAASLFNNFVQYRNNRFLPVKPDKELLAMLTPIDGIIRDAQSKINRIGLIAENFQYNTEALQTKLNNLLKRSEEQKFFLKKYFATTSADREQLMYRN